MKGLILTRNILICFLVLVFAGCTTVTPKSSLRARSIPNAFEGDAHINFKGGKLNSVSSSLAKKIVPGATIVWKIFPPAVTNKVRICLKTGSPNPFSDQRWQDGCEDSVNGEITGTVDTSKAPNGYIEFSYRVLDIRNNDEIDPPGVIYH